MKWSILKILVRKDGLALKLERMNALAFLWKLLSSWSVLGERKGRPCVSSSCTGGRHREGRRAERRSVGEGSPSREAGLRRPGLGQAAPPGQCSAPGHPPLAPPLRSGVPSSPLLGLSSPLWGQSPAPGGSSWGCPWPAGRSGPPPAQSRVSGSPHLSQYSIASFYKAVRLPWLPPPVC